MAMMPPTTTARPATAEGFLAPLWKRNEKKSDGDERNRSAWRFLSWLEFHREFFTRGNRMFSKNFVQECLLPRMPVQSPFRSSPGRTCPGNDFSDHFSACNCQAPASKYSLRLPQVGNNEENPAAETIDFLKSSALEINPMFESRQVRMVTFPRKVSTK